MIAVKGWHKMRGILVPCLALLFMSLFQSSSNAVWLETLMDMPIPRRLDSDVVFGSRGYLNFCVKFFRCSS